MALGVSPGKIANMISTAFNLQRLLQKQTDLAKNIIEEKFNQNLKFCFFNCQDLSINKFSYLGNFYSVMTSEKPSKGSRRIREIH